MLSFYFFSFFSLSVHEKDIRFDRRDVFDLHLKIKVTPTKYLGVKGGWKSYATLCILSNIQIGGSKTCL